VYRRLPGSSPDVLKRKRSPAAVMLGRARDSPKQIQVEEDFRYGTGSGSDLPWERRAQAQSCGEVPRRAGARRSQGRSLPLPVPYQALPNFIP
jgi:hypothetical protein